MGKVLVQGIFPMVVRNGLFIFLYCSFWSFDEVKGRNMNARSQRGAFTRVTILFQGSRTRTMKST